MNTVYSKTSHFNAPSLSNQQGVGLVEVLVALFIFAFGALSIASMQVSAVSAVRYSTSHLAIESIGREISEHLKANTPRAAIGHYNTTFTELTATTIEPEALTINSWKARVSSLLKDGATEIQCTAINCQIAVSWSEYTGSATRDQQYNINIPIYDN